MQVPTNNALEIEEPCPEEVIASCQGASGELVFVKEIVHRINNQLASTIGYVSHIALHSSDTEVKVALAAVMEHLYEHSRLYRALQVPAANRSIDVGAYLRELCEAISRAKLRPKGIKLTLVEYSLRLSPTHCWMLGMILAELITNSCRHAFAEAGGSIKVEFEKTGCRIECRVTDDGSAPRSICPGQGLKIVQGLAHGLHGEISHRFGETGSVAIVSFPVQESIEVC